MSALAAKQICAVMSALGQKADSCSATKHVRFPPKADISERAQKWRLQRLKRWQEWRSGQSACFLGYTS
jgi:hypothetical protein